MRRWIALLPYPPLIIAAILFGLAPFVPQPHLLEKLRLLAQGELRRGIDIFDLALHLAPTVLLLVKIALERPRRD